MNPRKTAQKIIKFIKQQAGKKPVVLGLSGGVDSSVVAYLAVKALGNKKVRALIMPSSTNGPDDLRLAKLVIKNLNLQFTIYNLQLIFNNYKKILKLKNHKLLGNLKARVRMSLLYAKANELDGLVLGTGNKSELMIGYFTKHGDGGADILPIGGLYKTEVKQLAEYLGVPREIVNRAPTAGLWKGQTDEGEIGVTYEKLDKILEAISDRGGSIFGGKKNKSLRKFNKREVEKVKQMIANSEHKRQLPPICEL